MYKGESSNGFILPCVPCEPGAKTLLFQISLEHSPLFVLGLQSVLVKRNESLLMEYSNFSYATNASHMGSHMSGYPE